MEAIVVVVISALLSSFAAYRLAHRQAELNLANKMDESISQERTTAYKVLWELTGLLPLYPPAENVTYESLGDLSRKFCAWYYSVGGIYLTEDAKEVYFDTQELLLTLSYQKTGFLKPCHIDSDCDYERVRQQLSALRTQLTEDLRSRRPPGALKVEEADSWRGTTEHTSSHPGKGARGGAMAIYLSNND